MPESDKSASPTPIAENWTWWVSFLALLVFLDLCALTYYFQALPESRFKNWEKIVSTGATWVSGLIAYLGIKYKFGEVTSLSEILRVRPVQLCIVGLSVLIWYFVAPFHAVEVSVVESGSSGKPLAGIKVKVDGETGVRPDISDAQGRMAIGGLLASSHDLRFVGEAYQDEVATAGFMDVLRFGQIRVSLKPKERRVEFRTAPDGADVYLDGDEKNRKGRTPLSLVLAGERTRVLFKKSGYQPTNWEEIAWGEVPELDGKRQFKRELRPFRTFPLIVASEPDGADIFVNGKLTNTTPFTVQLAEGQHRVEVKKDGHSKICSVRIPDPGNALPSCFAQLGGAAGSKP